MIIWRIIKNLKLPLLLLLLCGYTIIDSKNVYFALAFCMIMFPIMLVRKSLWDKNSGLLISWGIVYFLITAFYYAPNSWANEFVYLLGPACFYICGKLFVTKLGNQRYLLWTIFLICLVASLPIYILTISDILKGELIAYSRRLGNEEVALAATLYGLVAAIALSGLGFFVTAGKNTSKVIRWGFLILFACSLLTTIHLINRTGIVISLICLIALLATQKIGKMGKAIVYLIAIFTVIVMYFGTDWLMDSIDAYTYRNVNGYGIDSGGGRFDRWIDALGKFLEYPVGWWQNNSTYNARVHNLWLDIARVGGIIPFILIIIFFINGIRTQFILLKRYKKQPVVLILFGIFLSMCLAAAVEPVIEAKISYFCLIIFFMGMESAVYQCGNTLFISKFKK